MSAQKQDACDADGAYSGGMKATDILLPAPMTDAVIAPLKAEGIPLHALWEQPDPERFLAEQGGRIRGVATSTLYGRLGAELIEKLPNLEVIASFGVGYDNVDVAAAAARDVMVTNTPGVLDDEVADFTIGLLIATLRQIPQADRFLRDGLWTERAFPLSPTLRGRTIGIVGLGSIGKAIARRLEGFGVAIAYHGRHRQPGVGYPYYPSARALAAACDVLIAILPGGAATRHIIDAGVLKALGPEGVFINVARGSVVDQDALVAALNEQQIAAAFLDVTTPEPLPADDPLWSLDNAHITMHLSGRAQDKMFVRSAERFLENLERWNKGVAVEPRVDLTLGY